MYVVLIVCVTCVPPPPPPSGKAVFKKAVKLTLTVMPTQTISDNSIPFDGKTFSATFTQTAGTLSIP